MAETHIKAEVPREPTEYMVAQGIVYCRQSASPLSQEDLVKAIWRVMYDAAVRGQY